MLPAEASALIFLKASALNKCSTFIYTFNSFRDNKSNSGCAILFIDLVLFHSVSQDQLFQDQDVAIYTTRANRIAVRFLV